MSDERTPVERLLAAQTEGEAEEAMKLLLGLAAEPLEGYFDLPMHLTLANWIETGLAERLVAVLRPMVEDARRVTAVVEGLKEYKHIGETAGSEAVAEAVRRLCQEIAGARAVMAKLGELQGFLEGQNAIIDVRGDEETRAGLVVDGAISMCRDGLRRREADERMTQLYKLLRSNGLLDEQRAEQRVTQTAARLMGMVQALAESRAETGKEKG